MANTKNTKTKAQMYAEMIALFEQMNADGTLSDELLEEYKGRLEKDIEASQKKSTSTKKETEADKERASIKATILEVLEEAGKAMKYADFYKAVLAKREATEEEISKNKVTALCTQLGEKGSGEIKKYVEKKVTYIVLASLA